MIDSPEKRVREGLRFEYVNSFRDPSVLDRNFNFEEEARLAMASPRSSIRKTVAEGSYKVSVRLSPS
jgi:hypothetical protein